MSVAIYKNRRITSSKSGIRIARVKRSFTSLTAATAYLDQLAK